MVTTSSLIFAASGLVGLSQASPLTARQESTPYKTYLGDGSSSDGWPGVDDWLDFETLWERNSNYYPGACEWLEIGANTPSENQALRSAIRSVASDSGLDERFILAAVYQESAGCVRVKTSYSTNEGYRNPGLLQCFEGDHTCNDVEAGVELTKPCPDDEIYGMITDGVGITTQDGLLQTIERSGVSGDAKYYAGAVVYNSGLLPESGNLEDGRSNPCYGSDIANRLMGWVADSSPCDRDTIGN